MKAELTAETGRPRVFPRIVAVVLAAAVGLLLVVLTVEQVSAGAATVLLGPFDGHALIVGCTLLGTIAATIGVWLSGSLLSVRILALLLGVAASAFSALGAFVLSDTSVTTIEVNGCDTGYVVVERSFLFLSTGTIYRPDGPFIVVAAGRSSGDDGYMPFAAGTYAVTRVGDDWQIDYAIESGRAAADTSSLPVLAGHECTTASSGEGGWDPPPTPTPTPTPTRAVVRQDQIVDAVRTMIAASFDAAGGEVRDATGNELDAATLSVPLAPCDVPGTERAEVSLQFATADNARSLTRILEAWDDAGYLPDRAMQSDIRYSETLPVAQMTIRDRTTIDGLLHMTITSACAVSPGE
ncbi:hypothetical protein ACI3KS_07250 [Microbacterium sp. ZW T5_45]|uniref:hypothetical protein n=1 Tax=Microbacterium sp. ZW T5_45 TaxID=3378080 RepID=UPI003854FFDB